MGARHLQRAHQKWIGAATSCRQIGGSGRGQRGLPSKEMGQPLASLGCQPRSQQPIGWLHATGHKHHRVLAGEASAAMAGEASAAETSPSKRRQAALQKQLGRCGLGRTGREGYARDAGRRKQARREHGRRGGAARRTWGWLWACWLFDLPGFPDKNAAAARTASSIGLHTWTPLPTLPLPPNYMSCVRRLCASRHRL